MGEEENYSRYKLPHTHKCWVRNDINHFLIARQQIISPLERGRMRYFSQQGVCLFFLMCVGFKVQRHTPLNPLWRGDFCYFPQAILNDFTNSTVESIPSFWSDLITALPIIKPSAKGESCIIFSGFEIPNPINILFLFTIW